MSCLIITPEIRELAKKFPNEIEQSILNLVGLWQEKNNKSSEDIPIGYELQEFIKELRSSEATEQLDEALSSSFDTPRITSVEEQQKVDLLFDPKTRRDRVTLIARFFSNEVDSALQEIADSLRSRIDNINGVEREELQAELNNLDRFSAIKKLTPAGIFKRVFNIFNFYS